MNLGQILRILRVRWMLALAVTVVVSAGVAVYSLMLPKRYAAEASLLLDVKADPLVATFMPGMATPAYMATQIEILRSDVVAARVATLLKLRDDPKLLAGWTAQTKGRIPFESYAAELLSRNVTVEPVRASNILLITYVANEPKFAAQAANAFAQAYIDQSLELRVEPARQYATFFDERLKVLRSEYEAAQARLSTFQRENGIVLADGKLDQETARLNFLTAELATAQVVVAGGGRGGETSVDVQQSGAVQGLRSELGKAEAKLSEITSFAGANNPQRIQLAAQIEELKSQIAAEVRRVSATTATVNRQSAQKVNELRTMVETQKAAVLGLRAQRDGIAVLMRDVDTAQKAYDVVAQRRSQVSLESQSTQGSSRLLSPALEPIYPSKPNVPKNILAGVVGGLALGLAIALGLELTDRRVRSDADLMSIDGVPLLAVLSSSPSSTRYQRRTPLLGGPRGPQGPPQLAVDEGLR